MNLPQETDTLMFREAAETADVVAAQFARNADTIATLAQSLRENPPPFVVTCARGSSARMRGRSHIRRAPTTTRKSTTSTRSRSTKKARKSCACSTTWSAAKALPRA